jgi:hypothetical protein
MTESLSTQLEEIDAAISVLEDRRACIIHRMDNPLVTPVRDGNLIQFPAGNRVTVRKSLEVPFGRERFRSSGIRETIQIEAL